MKRVKKTPTIPIITRPPHIFDEVYPYEEGILKSYCVALLYQLPINSNQPDIMNPAQIKAQILYFTTLDEAFSAANGAVDTHYKRLLYHEVFYLRLTIDCRCWESLSRG